MKVIGSPVKLNRPKAMNATTVMTAKDCRMRRRMKASTGPIREATATARGRRATRTDDAESVADRQCGRFIRGVRRLRRSLLGHRHAGYAWVYAHHNNPPSAA